MISVIVAACRAEAEGIQSYELARADGTALPPFTAGAHIDVQVAPGLVRQYSLCNPPHEHQTYRIGVLKDPASRGGSLAMHGLQVGAELSISEPRNLFELAPEARHSVLFAGGIGITPILCMAEHLARQGKPFELHYCARSQAQAAFLPRLQAERFAGRTYLHFDDQLATRLDTLQVLAEPAPGSHLYVCGPGGFMAHVLESAEQQGWPPTSLHREYFSAAPVPQGVSEGAFQVRLASSGEVFDVPADKTIVQVLREHGYEIPVSCEQGICGTCLTKVLDGIPQHRDLYLSEDEQAQNDQLTPCCSRAVSPLLVLDL